MTGSEATLLGFGVAAVAAAALFFTAHARANSGQARNGATSTVTTQKTANGLAQQGQSGGPGNIQQVTQTVQGIAGAVGGIAGALGGLFGGFGGSSDGSGSSLDMGGVGGDETLTAFSGGDDGSGNYDFGAGLDFSGDSSGFSG